MLPEDAIKKLKELDNGRFSKLINVMNITDLCFSCRFFIKKSLNEYRCKTAPSCIVATISKPLKSYFLWKLDIITKKQHLDFLEAAGEIAPKKKSGYIIPIGVKRR